MASAVLSDVEDLATGREQWVERQNWEFSANGTVLRPPDGVGFYGALYFSFTKSKTKIAHTPTVTGNCTKAASRIEPPRGKAYVRNIIARAVSMPNANLVFQFMSG
jgi:hypothetical protein